MKKTALSKNIFIIDGFWSASMCNEFIQRSEAKGYEAATIQTENGPRLVDHIRNNNRVVYKDFELANQLWLQLNVYAPAQIG